MVLRTSEPSKLEMNPKQNHGKCIQQNIGNYNLITDYGSVEVSAMGLRPVKNRYLDFDCSVSYERTSALLLYHTSKCR